MKVSESWAGATDRLSAHGVPEPSLEAEVLVRHALGVDRSQFFANLNQGLVHHQKGQIDRLVERRILGEPLAYIRGHREFYGLEFVVNRHVLVPRQETETLVDEVLELSSRPPLARLRIADIGTGSGAIAVSIAVNETRAVVFATDASREALEIADANCVRHGVSERVQLLRGDLVEPLPGLMDIIVSNPPYIRSAEIEGLQAEVRREPTIALDGGHDGLEPTRRLLREAPDKLRPGGSLVIEIEPEQVHIVRALASKAAPRGRVYSIADIQGVSRAVVLALP